MQETECIFAYVCINLRGKMAAVVMSIEANYTPEQSYARSLYKDYVSKRRMDHFPQFHHEGNWK